MWGGREGGPGCPSGQPGKKTAQVKTTTQRYFSRDSMLNHSTCNRFFFVQQPRRSARRSPGSARGFGRVAQVRAEVRVTHKQFSQRILRISSSSVPSECLASQFPASVAGRSSQRPRVSCACSASRFDLIELPSLSEQKCDLDGTRHCSSGG